MKTYKYIDEYKDTTPLAIAIGKFDGLHKGHQSLIDHIVEHPDVVGEAGSDKKKMATMVIAFDMKDYFLEHGIDYEVLTTPEEKQEKLKMEYGYLLDHALLCTFTDHIAFMEPEEFVKEILVEKLKCKYLIVGEEFRFGKGAKGDTWKLEQLGEVYDFEVQIMKKETYKEEPISSTRIKELVQKGSMEEVKELLTEPYSITSAVIHGAKLGRTIGFPTLNLAIPLGKILPPRGVYSCSVHIKGDVYLGVANLGRKPTVSDEPVDLLEVHVFDFAGDIYGEIVRVELLEYYRPEQKFANLESLVEQLHLDADLVRSSCEFV